MAIIVLSPILFFVIILLRLTGEGEVFFIQNRIGKGKTIFGLIKFVTMKKNSPSLGTGSITIKDDPRVLPLGKYLRKAKINELPQLFNILYGHMSVVGPRPLTKDTFEAYDIKSQDIISKVTPGLSGLGSIVFRDEESILSKGVDSVKLYKDIIAPYKANLEIWFVNNQSLKLYFSLIIATIWVVFRPDSKIITKWKVFNDAPKPGYGLKKYIKN